MSASAVTRIRAAIGELTAEENVEVVRMVVGLLPENELIDLLASEENGLLEPMYREELHATLDEEFGEKPTVERTEVGDPDSA